MVFQQGAVGAALTRRRPAVSGNNVGDDLKSMAQDVADLGAGYVRMGRRWLEMQRRQVSGAYDGMASREVPPQPGEGRSHRRAGPHGSPRGSTSGAGAGPDSYLDDDLSPGYASPGRTQSPFGDTTGGSDSDYLPPGSASYGRASYRGVGPKNYTRSDQRITEDVCERLTRCEHVDPSDVSVNVSGGVVSLTGTVRERWMKHRIEDLAAACDGVRSVENRVQVPTADRPSEGVSAGDSTLPETDL
ncbi:BON domain-containing protein [Lysobacter sp. H21R4]|nr:BON domain-containing protein [Lysobacter sp. H21R4]